MIILTIILCAIAVIALCFTYISNQRKNDELKATKILLKNTEDEYAKLWEENEELKRVINTETKKEDSDVIPRQSKSRAQKSKSKVQTQPRKSNGQYSK